MTAGAAVLVNRAPQPPQNFAAGTFSKRQLGQMLTSRVPHSLQNRQSGAFSAAHPEQRILRAHFFKSRGHWGMSDSCLSAAPRCLSRKHIVLPFRGSLQPNPSWQLRIPTANPPATFRGRSPTKTTTKCIYCRFSATMRTRRFCPAFQSDLPIVSSKRRMRNCCVLNAVNKRAGSIETGVRLGV